MNQTQGPRTRIKDKKICIFYEMDQPEGSIKIYIHPAGTFINAHVRQLTSSEQNAADSTRDGSALQFTINKREIKTDMFVEFRGKTYQMGPPDNFEFYSGEIKFIAYEVSPKEHVAVEWSEW